jgi:predicted RNA binding protein YcfA (HicA-like mRNA interferase family)
MVQSIHSFGPVLSARGDSFADAMKVRDILRLLRDDGWFEVATRGSHVQLKHATKSGRVTVAGHPNDDLAPGTLKSILEQAKLKEH